MSNLNLVKHYFELSNNADLVNIETLLSKHVVYSSENVGLHFGNENVMRMKREFFGKFESIHWEVLQISEIQDNIFEIDFILNAILTSGEKINKNGKETVVVNDEKIHFIEVKNK